MWSNLPNAAHIDRVLASLKANPKIWADALNAVRDAAYKTSRKVALNAAFDALGPRDPLVFNPDGPLGLGLIPAPRRGARDATWDAILALVAYDDSAKYLDMPLDQLKMLYVLTEHPAALLLQPAAQVFAMERELA